MKVRDHLLSLINAADFTDRRLSRLSTGSTETVRNIRRGANPRTDTLEAICRVLDIEIHLVQAQHPPPAPPEIIQALDLAPAASLPDAVEAIRQRLSGQAMSEEIITALKSEIQALRHEVRQQLEGLREGGDLADEHALSAPGTSAEVLELPGARPIAVHRLQTAAGGGALDLDETVKGYAYFRSEWLSRKGLYADRCSLIGVVGESMEPTLPEGCVILVDRNQRQRRDGRIFVLRTGVGLVVKRAGKSTPGHWQLVSDHPRWPDTPWPMDAVVIGEVRWMAREL